MASFFGLFTSTNRKIGSFTADSTLSEDHDSTIEITSNPVELGADISDHAIILPKIININGIITDNPMTLEGAIDFFSGSTSRSKGGWNDLLKLQEKREPLEVQTGLKLYKDMILTNLKTKQDVKTSAVLNFTAQLKEIRIVNTEFDVHPPGSLADGDTTSQATSPSIKGQIQGAALPIDSSVLSNITSFFGF